MTDKELQKLGRRELLELLVSQADEIEQLKKSLERAEAKARSREITISKAGSIAEAALALNGVFGAAQAAAEQYLVNIKNTEEICRKMQEAAEQQANQMIEAAEKKAFEVEKKAKEEADQYWNEVSKRLDLFYEEHAGLQELLRVKNLKMTNP